MNGEVTGRLDALLLAVLAGSPAHGYAVIERLRERSGGAFDLPEGTIYPALHRLEAAGLLRSRWDESAPRRRRVYSLTARGRRRLEHEKREWGAFTRAVNLVLEGSS